MPWKFSYDHHRQKKGRRRAELSAVGHRPLEEQLLQAWVHWPVAEEVNQVNAAALTQVH